jgi:hypothetical protein
MAADNLWPAGAPLLWGEDMDPVIVARREIGLEIQQLSDEFEKSDQAAFSRMRIFCYGVTALVTIAALVLLIIGGDWRYLLAFWAILMGITWIWYWASVRRQRRQTERLKALAMRWRDGMPPVTP